jgi:hypothetical protein
VVYKVGRDASTKIVAVPVARWQEPALMHRCKAKVDQEPRRPSMALIDSIGVLAKQMLP